MHSDVSELMDYYAELRSLPGMAGLRLALVARLRLILSRLGQA